MRLIILMLSCYRFISIPSLFITLVSAAVLFQLGDPLFLVIAIWTKVITTGLLMVFLYFFRSTQFFFYNNLGLSNRSIYAILVIIDFMVAALSFSLALL